MNPVVTRLQIIRGPGRVTVGGLVIDDKDAINCVMDAPTDDIMTSLRGKVDTIATDNIVKTTLTPYGGVTQALLDFLFKWQPKDIGASVFGDVDVPLSIHSRHGTKVGFKNSGLVKAPNLLLSPIRTAFGQIEIDSVVGLTDFPGDAGAYYSVTSEAFPTNYNQPDPMVGAPYFGSWGTFDVNDTEDGWTITTELQMTPEKTSNRGTVDFTFTGITVTAKCVPVDKTEAQIIDALPINRRIGASLNTGVDLVIGPPAGVMGLGVTLKNASPVSGPLNWGSGTRRIGELVWQAHADATGLLYLVKLMNAAA